MLIAQITDLHLGFEPGNRDELNQHRLEAVAKALLELDVKPDLLLVTGDIADKGEAESYARVRQVLDRLPFPVFGCPGNHDDRSAYLAAFPSPLADGFVQYAVEDFPLRVLVLDTLEEGRHGGAFCKARAAWLDQRLSEQPQRPTLLALHHPPVDTGIAWMGAASGEPWAQRLAAVVSRHAQVVAAVSGHMHRMIAAPWAGTTLVVSPSVAPNLSLTLKPVDLDRPDERPLVEMGPPAFTLHQWLDGRVLSHFQQVTDNVVLARYNTAIQPFVRHLAEERGEGA